MNQIDFNKDGRVDKSELSRFLSDNGFTLDDLRKITKSKDSMSNFENFLVLNPQMIKDFLDAYKEVAALEKYKKKEQEAVISKTKQYLSEHAQSITQEPPLEVVDMSVEREKKASAAKPVEVATTILSSDFQQDSRGKYAETSDKHMATVRKPSGSTDEMVARGMTEEKVLDAIGTRFMSDSDKQTLKDRYTSGIDLDTAFKILGSKQEDFGNDYSKWNQSGYQKKFLMSESSSAARLARLEQLYKDNDKFRAMVDDYARITKSGSSFRKASMDRQVLDQIGAGDVFDFMGDVDSSGKLDKSDEGTTHGKDLKAVLIEIESQNPDKFYKSISFIFKKQGVDINISNRNELYEAFKKRPELKQIFLQSMLHLNSFGINAFRSIKDGPDAIKRFFEERVQVKNSKLIEGVRNSMMSKISESPEYKKMEKDLEVKTQDALNQGIEGLKKHAKTLPESERAKAEETIKQLENSQTKQRFMDRVKFEGLNLLISTVEKKEGAFLGVDFSNKDINKVLKESTGDVIKAMKISFGVMGNGAGVMPGVGLSIVYGKQFGDLSVGGQAGTFMLVPYATMNVAYQLNSDSIKKAGLEDFDVTAKKVGVNANVAWIGSITGGVGVGFSRDLLEGINQKGKHFKEFMDKSFNRIDPSQPASVTIQTIRDRMSANCEDADRPYLDKVIKNIETTFQMYGYDTISVAGRKEFLDKMSDAYVQIWYEKALTKASEKGYQLHSFGLGLQFLVGYFPLPFVNLSLQKVKPVYELDRAADLEAALKRNEGIGGESLSPRDIDEFARYLSNYLKTSNVKVSKTPEGLIKLSGNPDIINSGLNIKYNPSVSSEMRYDNGSLILGNVGTIKHDIAIREKGKRYHTLIIGANGENGTQILDTNVVNQFVSNNPTKIDFTTSREGGTLIGGRDADFDKLIYSNLDKFPGMSHIKGYVEFKKAYNAFDYPKARQILVKMLNAKGLKTLSASLAKVEEAKLPYVLGQINAAIMTDSSTKDKIVSDEKYSSSIAVKILELKKYKTDDKVISMLEEINNDKSKYQSNRSKIEAAIGRYKDEALVQEQAGGDETNKHSSKIVKVLQEIKAMFVPLKDVLSQRTNTFKGITESVKLPEIMNLREEWIKINGDKTNMEEKFMDNAFGLMATYKRGSGYKGFDKQIGVVSVVGQPVEITDPKVREFMVRGYGDKNLGKFLGSYDSPENREKLIQHMVDPSKPLVINGQDISFSGIRFMFNGGGRCFNESLIMQIPKSITIGSKTSGLSLTTDGSSDLYLVEGDSSILGVAFSTGKKIPVERRIQPVILLQEKKKEEPQPQPEPEKPAPTKAPESTSSGGGGGGGGSNECPPASATTTGTATDSGVTTGSTSPNTSPSGGTKGGSK